MRVFVCTRDRQLVRLERNGGSWRSDPTLEDLPVTCVAAYGDHVLLGTQGQGAWRSENGGEGWEHIDLPEANVFSVAISPADGALYAGTEPSRLFVSREGGPWAELEALQEIPSRESWSFPPRPWTHHVRWIAPDPHTPQRLLVGIELGGLMYTDDGGTTFTDHRQGAKRDVHALAWHPSAEGRAYEAAGDGAAWSADGGLNWESLDAGRDLGYCWALAWDPADPERWYVSASSSPFVAHSGEKATGKLYRWQGDGWSELPVPGASMPYALASSDAELIAGMTDGRILHSPNRGASWEDVIRIGSVVAMATA